MGSKLNALEAANLHLASQNTKLSTGNQDLSQELAALKQTMKHDTDAVNTHLAKAQQAAGLMEGDIALLTQRLEQNKRQRDSLSAEIQELQSRLVLLNCRLECMPNTTLDSCASLNLLLEFCM